jgi:hypothetical protein
MKRVVEEFQVSGLTRREFCQQRDLSVTRLDYWRQRMARKPRLVQVKVAGSEAAARSFTLRLGNGRSIDSSWRFEEEDLARLIRVAERA